jgi:hypothetical protein
MILAGGEGPLYSGPDLATEAGITNLGAFMKFTVLGQGESSPQRLVGLAVLERNGAELNGLSPF